MDDFTVVDFTNTLRFDDILNDDVNVRKKLYKRIDNINLDNAHEDLPIVKMKCSKYCVIDISVWSRKGISKEWLWKLLKLSAIELKDVLNPKKNQVLQEVIGDIKYGLVSNSLARLIPLLDKLSKEITVEPYIINFDGSAASGKSTLAGYLAEITKSSLIHMDDFYLPNNLRTDERFMVAGGNIHYERFKEEVVDFLRNGHDFIYLKFDCSIMDYSEEIRVSATPIIIVEGSYSNHPYFGDYPDLKVFCNVGKTEQIKRIELRNGIEKLKVFLDKWIPLENHYLQVYKIKENCHIVL